MQKWMAVRLAGRKSVPAQCAGLAQSCVPLTGLLWSQGSSLCPIGKTAVVTGKLFMSHWQDCWGHRKALCVPLARLLLSQKSSLCPIGKTVVVTGQLSQLCVFPPQPVGPVLDRVGCRCLCFLHRIEQIVQLHFCFDTVIFRECPVCRTVFPWQKQNLPQFAGVLKCVNVCHVSFYS